MRSCRRAAKRPFGHRQQGDAKIVDRHGIKVFPDVVAFPGHCSHPEVQAGSLSNHPERCRGVG